jgi:hypothetical protein
VLAISRWIISKHLLTIDASSTTLHAGDTTEQVLYRF